MFREALELKHTQLGQLDKLVGKFDKMINEYAKDHVEIQLLQTIPGFGPIVSSNFYSIIGDGKAFSNSRGVSASLGIVPRQHSSGGKNTLLGISKRGDKYLRSLLIHGARAVVRVAHTKDDALSRWVVRLIERRGQNKATVALANKLARIGWAVITHGKPYEANYHAV
jgi:transposase